MKAPRPRPSYANAGANRDRPRLLPSEGPALRRALDKAGVASETDVAAAEAAAAAAAADAALASGDAAAAATDASAALADAATVAANLATHEGAGNPHPQYASTTSMDALVGAFIDHEAAVDPHPGYQQESEKGNANGYASLDGDGKVPAAQIPAGGGTVLADLYTFVGTLGSDATTGANTTPIDLTGLVFSYEASSVYRIWFMGDVDPAAATTGCGFQLNLSSTVTSVSLSFYHQLANTGTLSGGHSIADDASVGVSSGLPGTSQYPVVGEARLITNGNTGTAQLRFRSETNAAITCKAGMTLVVEKVA